MGNDKEFQVIVKAKDLAEHTIRITSKQAHARFGDCERLINTIRRKYEND